jgi:hypothetical protein
MPTIKGTKYPTAGRKAAAAAAKKPKKGMSKGKR